LNHNLSEETFMSADITITINVNDWRDVPWDADADRAVILQDIVDHVIWEAERLAIDKHDIAVSGKREED
jgi:hypothetical protein